MVKSATAERYSGTRTDMLAVDVGRRIRTARLERGMSLADLGGEDLSRSFLSLVELGRSRISLRALSIVAERLELPISYFLDDASGGNAAAELELDQVESAIARQQPDEALRLLDDSEIPALMKPRALFLRGRALIAAGRPREAVPPLLEALGTAERRGDGLLVLHARYTLGAALYVTGNYDEALTHLRRALEDASQEPQDPVLLGKITVTIGHALYVRGEIEAAIERYARARDLFGKISDLQNLGSVYSGLSLAYKRMGDMTSALRYSKLSLGAYDALQNGRAATLELNNLAEDYLQIGDLTRAAECAREAVERAMRMNTPDVEAMAHATLAAIYLRQDDYAAAGEQAQAADAMASTDDVAHAGAWIVLAELAERDGNPSRADDLYGRALAALQKSGRHNVYADASLAYSRLLRNRGDSERALDFALQAAEARTARPA